MIKPEIRGAVKILNGSPCDHVVRRRRLGREQGSRTCGPLSYSAAYHPDANIPKRPTVDTGPI
jgi:hypothetical protein